MLRFRRGPCAREVTGTFAAMLSKQGCEPGSCSREAQSPPARPPWEAPRRSPCRGVLAEDGCSLSPAESGRPGARCRPRPFLRGSSPWVFARGAGTPVRGGLSPNRAGAASSEEWLVLVWLGVGLGPGRAVRGVVERPTAGPRLPLCPLALGRTEPPGLADLDHGVVCAGVSLEGQRLPRPRTGENHLARSGGRKPASTPCDPSVVSAPPPPPL